MTTQGPEATADRLLSTMIGLPGVTITRPVTHRETLPLAPVDNAVATVTHQLIRHDDEEGRRVVAVVEATAGEVRRALVIPHDALRSLVTAYGRMTRRGTVEEADERDRRDRRRAALTRKRRRDCKDGKHDRRPVKACEGCRDKAAALGWAELAASG